MEKIKSENSKVKYITVIILVLLVIGMIALAVLTNPEESNTENGTSKIEETLEFYLG